MGDILINELNKLKFKFSIIYDNISLGKSKIEKMRKWLGQGEIKKIVRSQLQADIIKNNFNVEVDGIDEDFNLEKIYEICQRK